MLFLPLFVILDKHSEQILDIIQEIRRRGLKVVIAGIPKTIDNDIPVCLIPWLNLFTMKFFIISTFARGVNYQLNKL